ncbi:MAG: tetratricopeptide repeat protein [Candidatus Omnitrophica bacterium]|nr:tetratricopeptide repeat protein [Candidatus Omnitrophota bacterium]
MKKILIYYSIFGLIFYLGILTTQAAEIKKAIDSSQEQQVTKEEILELKNKFNKLEHSLYERVLEDAKISLESAKQATSLVSVASYIFILISFLLGLLGLREWKNILKVRKKAENDINLVRHISLADMYFRNGMNTEASKEYEEVLKLDPNNLIAHLQLGFLYTDIYKERAIEHCKKVTELDKNNFVAYLNWGVNLDHTTAPKKEVLKIYEIAERIGVEQKIDNVSLGKVKRFMGGCYEALKENDLALNKYKEAKERLLEAKKSNIPDVVRAAEYWLKDLDEIINRLEQTKTAGKSKPNQSQ